MKNEGLDIVEGFIREEFGMRGLKEGAVVAVAE
jgi:hypothetical protein